MQQEQFYLKTGNCRSVILPVGGGDKIKTERSNTEVNTTHKPQDHLRLFEKKMACVHAILYNTQH